MLSTSFLIDTNILSEFVRKRPDPGVLQWAREVRRVAVSVATLEEVYFGLSWKPNPRVRLWLEGFLDTNCEILPVTPEIAKRSGEIRGQFQARGQTRSTADMIIASTAQEHDLTLVTRNVRDFAECGILLLNPFREA
ncbi:MAG TPA: type II toxin-antitoxin system VapC family toxin [Thermoanaerobaculia bacterium]|nr:type II toxin-antitoxin system VapC family toxin [Thermoanaerobaculia bacterium]